MKRLKSIAAKRRAVPLMWTLIATQVAVGVACSLLMFVTINRMIESEAEGRLLQIRQIVEARVKPVERQLRTWKFLGMDAALQSSVLDIERSVPGVHLSFSAADQVTRTPSIVVFPEATEGNELPIVMVAELPTLWVTNLIQPKSVTFWSILAMGALLMAAVIWSAFFTRRHFHQPISLLHDAFMKLQIEGKLNIDSIKASGEVSALIKNISKMYDSYRGVEAERAVARMTAMLAHDVRKPFSLLRMGLVMLAKAKDREAVERILAGLLPEVDKAVNHVDGLISDVMEVASTSTNLIQESTSPTALIATTLDETFRAYPTSDIAITHDLRHTRMVNAHAQKVGRVLSNIVANAVQAVTAPGGEGAAAKRQIWFRSRDLGGTVEVCVGNAGSFIPPENLSKLFEAFFTIGKKCGTGLGLAIAEKVVKAHGGRIWCESSKTPEHPDGKVEFFFTLPMADGVDTTPALVLPGHSSEITMALPALAGAAADGLDEGEMILEAAIVQARSDGAAPIRVLVVDDEAVYRLALVSYLGCTPALTDAIAVVACASAAEALASDRHFDLVLTDVDMGAASLDGFELVRRLRHRGLGSMICVHSNRIVAVDHQTAITAGADAFLPKPMARAQLLRLVLQAVGRRQASTGAQQPRQGREVLVVDDNLFVLEAWSKMLGKDATVHSASSLAGVEALLAGDPGLIGRLDLVITDYHLDDHANGDAVGRTIKGLRPSLNIFLSTEIAYDPRAFAGAIDRVITKEPVPLASLL